MAIVIYRGTTPTFTIETDFNPNACKQLWVTFKQHKVEITKEIKDIDCGPNTICVKLTQEETLKFECSKVIDMQIRGVDYDGNAFVTGCEKFEACGILKDGVIK